MPALFASYKMQDIETRLKKNYSSLEQAVYNVETIDFTVDSSRNGVLSWFNTYIEPYLRIGKICKGEAGCWHTYGVTKYLNNNTTYQDVGTLGAGGEYTLVTLQLDNGAQIDIDYYSPNSMKTNFGTITNETGIGIYLDANGNKGPNIIGKDIYVLGFSSEKGLQPACNDFTDDQINTSCSPNGNGICCLKKVMQDSWKIDPKVFNKRP